MDQTPTIGRIVHYQPTLSQDAPAPAIVTATGQPTASGSDDGVDLAVFYQSYGLQPVSGVEYSEEPQAGYWSWPPRI